MAGDEVTMRAKLDSTQFTSGAKEVADSAGQMADAVGELHEAVESFSGTSKASLEVNATQAIRTLEQYEEALNRVEASQGRVRKADVAALRQAASTGVAGNRAVAGPNGGVVFRDESGAATGGLSKGGVRLNQEKAQKQLDRITQALTTEADATARAAQSATQRATAEQTATEQTTRSARQQAENAQRMQRVQQATQRNAEQRQQEQERTAAQQRQAEQQAASARQREARSAETAARKAESAAQRPAPLPPFTTSLGDLLTTQPERAPRAKQYRDIAGNLVEPSRVLAPGKARDEVNRLSNERAAQRYAQDQADRAEAARITARDRDFPVPAGSKAARYPTTYELRQQQSVFDNRRRGGDPVGTFTQTGAYNDTRLGPDAGDPRLTGGFLPNDLRLRANRAARAAAGQTGLFEQTGPTYGPQPAGPYNDPFRQLHTQPSLAGRPVEPTREADASLGRFSQTIEHTRRLLAAQDAAIGARGTTGIFGQTESAAYLYKGEYANPISQAVSDANFKPGFTESPGYAAQQALLRRANEAAESATGLGQFKPTLNDPAFNAASRARAGVFERTGNASLFEPQPGRTGPEPLAQGFQRAATEVDRLVAKIADLGKGQLSKSDRRLIDDASRGVEGNPLTGSVFKGPRDKDPYVLKGPNTEAVAVTGSGKQSNLLRPDEEFDKLSRAARQTAARLLDEEQAIKASYAEFEKLTAAEKVAVGGFSGFNGGRGKPPTAPPPPPEEDPYQAAARRREIASGQVAAGKATSAGGYTIGKDLDGQLQVTESRTGRLVTEFRELNAASEALTASLRKEAQAQHQVAEEANKTPLGEFYKGVFGAGGRKRRGGAQDVDESNPLNGLFETAGVVAKYEVLGRGLSLITTGALDAVKSYAALDEAVAGFNAQLGQGNEVSTAYVNNLENIASAAGQDVVGAIQSAQRGAAAFGTPGNAASQKAAGLATAQATSTNALVTGQDAKGSTDDLIAIATSYGRTADGLNAITNAVAVAKETFGANAKDIQDGLAGIADVGATSGFSMEQLAQVIGDVAAKTGESGSTIATNLTRIFSTLKTPGTSATLANTLGINLSGSVKEKIEQLAAAYPKLTKGQQDSLAATVGGAKGLRDLLPLLKDQPALQAAYGKALTDSGAGQREANAQLNSLGGRFRAFSALLKQVGLDIAKSGILTPLLAIFAAVEPLVKVLDTLIQTFDKLPGPIREGAAALIEAVVALNAFKAAQASGLAGGLGGLGRSVRGVGTAVFGNPFRDRTSTSTAAATAEANAKALEASAAEIEAAGRQGAIAIGKAAEELAVATKAGVGVAEAEANLETVRTNSINQGLIAEGRRQKLIEEGNVATAEQAAARKVAETEVDTSAGFLAAALKRAGIAADYAFKPVLATGEGYTNSITAAATGAEAKAAARGSVVEDIAFGASNLRGKAKGIIGADAAEAGIGLYGAKGLLREGSVLSKLGFGQKALQIPGLAAEGSTLAGLGATGLVGAAGVGAVAYGSYKLYEQGNAERSAIGKADAAQQTQAGGSAETLQAKADALNTAADGIAHASSGLIGTVGGALGEVFGNQDRGVEKTAARNQAAALSATATKLGNVTQQNYGAFDLSATDGVAQGLKTLALNGLTAQQQIDALNKALDGTAPLAAGAARRLGDPTAVTTAALGIGTDINQNIQQYADDDRSAIGAFFSRHGAAPTRNAGKQLGKLDQNQFTTGIQADATTLLNQDGLAQGATITPDTIKLLTGQLQDKVRQRLAEQGIAFANLPKQVQQQLLDSAKGGAIQALNSVDGATPQVITTANVQAIIDAEPGLATTAGQNASTNVQVNGNATLGGAPVQGPHLETGDVQGARLALKDSKDTELKIIKSGKANAQQLAQYRQEQVALQLNLQNALLAQDQEYAALADSMVSPFNAGAALQQALKDAQQALKDAGQDPGKKAAAQAAINNINKQIAAQGITDTNTIADRNVDSRNAVQVAQHQLQDDRRYRNAVVNDPKSGKAERDAANKKVREDGIALAVAVQSEAAIAADAKVAVGDNVALAFQHAADLYAQAKTDRKNSPEKAARLKAAAEAFAQAQELQAEQDTNVATAKIDPRATLALDSQRLAGDIAKRNALPSADKNGRALANIQIAQDTNQQRQDRIAQANAIRDAGVDSRDTVGQARAALADANATLGGALPGTQAYAVAQKDVAQKTLDLATAQEALAHSAAESTLGPNQTVGKAAEDLRHAVATAHLFKAGQEGYNTAQQQVLDAQQAYADAVNATSFATDKAKINPQDTVGQAQANLKDVNRRIKSYTGPRTGVDAGGFENLIAERNADQQAQREAIANRANARTESRVDPRDTVGEARAAVTNATRTLRADDRGSQQYYQDLKALQVAKLALAQTENQLASDTAEAGIDSRNLVGEAAQKVTDAKNKLALDKVGSDQYEIDLKAYKDSQLNEAQAATAVANAALEAGVTPGDALAAARAQIQEAENNLKNDVPGTAQYYQDLKQLKDAQYALAQANLDYANTLDLLGRDITDPVAQAQAAVDAARRKLASDSALKAGPDVLAGDQLSVQQSQNAEQKALFEQQLSDANTNFQLHRTSGAAYIQYLRATQANLKATGLGTRQLLDEYNEVSQALLSANQQLTGQFNIGNIKLPTVYQERRVAATNGIDITAGAESTGSNSFGASNNPLQQAAQSAIQPVSAAIAAISTQSAVAQLTALQQVLDALGGNATPAAAAGPAGSSVTGATYNNQTTINGADFAQVVNYLSSVLGTQAITSKSVTNNKKVP